VTRGVETSNLLILLRCTCTVIHVAQMILAFVVVDVVLDELVLVQELEKDGEQAE